MGELDSRLYKTTPNTFSEYMMRHVVHALPMLESHVLSGGYGADWLFYIKLLEENNNAFFSTTDKRQLRWEYLREPGASSADYLFGGSGIQFTPQMEELQWLAQTELGAYLTPLSTPHQIGEMNMWVVGVQNTAESGSQSIVLPFIFPESAGFITDHKTTNIFLSQVRRFLNMQQGISDTMVTCKITQLHEDRSDRDQIVLDSEYSLTDFLHSMAPDADADVSTARTTQLGTIFYNPRWVLAGISPGNNFQNERFSTHIGMSNDGLDIPIYSGYERWQTDNTYGTQRISFSQTRRREYIKELNPITIGQLVVGYEAQESNLPNGLVTTSENMLAKMLLDFDNTWIQIAHRIDNANKKLIQSAAILSAISLSSGIIARRQSIQKLLSKNIYI